MKVVQLSCPEKNAGRNRAATGLPPDDAGILCAVSQEDEAILVFLLRIQRGIASFDGGTNHPPRLHGEDCP